MRIDFARNVVYPYIRDCLENVSYRDKLGVPFQLPFMSSVMFAFNKEYVKQTRKDYKQNSLLSEILNNVWFKDVQEVINVLNVLSGYVSPNFAEEVLRRVYLDF